MGEPRANFQMRNEDPPTMTAAVAARMILRDLEVCDVVGCVGGGDGGIAVVLLCLFFLELSFFEEKVEAGHSFFLMLSSEDWLSFLLKKVLGLEEAALLLPEDVGVELWALLKSFIVVCCS